MPATPLRKTHHHGDLRAALIKAGIAILTEEGLEGLSLRKCAARAGVSHAAPGHHFDGVAGLRAAIAAAGYDRFRKTMERAAEGITDPRGRLRAICRGYLDFARTEPALFALIFSQRGATGPMDEVRAAAAPSYAVLARTCAPFVPPGTDPQVIETQVWSLVHGFAQLLLHDAFPQGHPPPDDAVIALVDRVGCDPGP